MGWIAAGLAVGFFHWGADYWWSKWAVLLSLVTVALAFRLGKSHGAAVGAAFGWTAFSGLYLFTWRESYVQTFDAVTATSMDATAAYTTACFVILTFFVSGLSSRELGLGKRALGIFSLVDSLWTVGGYLWVRLFGGDLRTSVGGFFDQYSMNGCFLAVSFPFAFPLALELLGPRGRRLRGSVAFFLLSVIMLVILVGETRSVFGVLLAVFLSPLLLPGVPGRLRLRRAALGSLIMAALLCVCFRFRPERIFYSSGRFPAARTVFSWLFEKPLEYWLFGLGNGSFFIFGPGIQRLTHADFGGPGYFLWLHSDWAQTVFELGIVGLFLYVWLFVDCLRRARQRGDRALLAALSGFGVTALYQYPVHLAPFALTGLLLVALATAPEPLPRPGAAR